ncbi:MAG: aminopeptidase [Alistipes sp.]|jgi:bleomycin hydrolase|nr:aminopeptidase [Alistipes sp.]
MKKSIATLFCTLFAAAVVAQPTQPTPPAQATAQAEGYVFTDTKTVPATSVKNQASSGTCWSFSGLAFFESEILVAGGPELDLSPMFVVRNAYRDRAVKYVRMHGTSSLSGGAAAEDVLICWRNHGIVPTEVYGGIEYGEQLHRHGELDAVIKGYCDAVIENANRKLSTAWLEGLDAILDAYLGEVPETFTYNGVEYTPRSFADSLPISMDDYVSLTSFTHHPFYEWMVIEVPDNTVWGRSFNVPLDEMMGAMTGAIEAGYPVLWSADVSERGFDWRKGLAVVPEADVTRMDDSELSRWVALSEAEKNAALYNLDGPGTERTITQEVRQTAFDNWETTDDHGMELTATATDQNGNKYFKVKNSWGTDGHIYDGYFYASHPYIAYKTICVLINREVLPKELQKKL